jgi:eukaryotic-like serine/threonine-protein kinase
MTLLDNRYQVTRELGEGAFGKTYIAVDTRSPMKRQCVVKQLKLVATPEQNRFYQSLFEREAEVLEQIGQKAQGRIPNLLAYFTQAGEHFFVMELVAGPTLADCIAKSGRQDEATVREWLSKILETLDFLHGVEYKNTQGKNFQGVIHRDIKPGNIIIRESDCSPVLIDFGVVKEIAVRSTVGKDGTTTMTAGTAFFMPPEQEKGHPVTASDLFALGVTAMVALTGKQPIEFYDLTDLTFEWRKYAPEISSELANVLDRATQTKARNRFQSAREMLDLLSPCPLEQSPPKPFLPTPAPFSPTQATPNPLGVTPRISEMERNQQNGESAVFSARIEVVYIPAGEFQMGSRNGELDEGPVHRVVIPEPIWMGKYAVTQAQWESVMGNNPSHFKGHNLPVETVSWDDCQEFIRRLKAIGDGYTYRLPTEAEWEYACRAGTTGDYAGNLDAFGWYEKNSGDETHPVGQKEPNAWGLYDMHGNVWEWCADWYGTYLSYSVTNPTGPSSGSLRVRRGGSWGGTAAYCRAAARSRNSPGARRNYLGLRLVRLPQLSLPS